MGKKRIRVAVGIRDATVLRPEAGIDGQLGKVGESCDLPRVVRPAV